MACSNSSDDELRNVSGDFLQNCKRQVHNRVERRRKDKINSWIIHIGELLPDKDPKRQSKNEILERAAKYIKHLKEMNESLLLEKCTEIQAEEFQRMKKQIANLGQLNDSYVKLLKAAGIPPCSSPDEVWDNRRGKYSHKFSAAQGSALIQQCENGFLVNGTTPKEKSSGNLQKRDSRFKSDSDSSQNSDKANSQDSDGADNQCQTSGESQERSQDRKECSPDANEAANGFFATSDTANGGSQNDSTSQKSSQKLLTQDKVDGKSDTVQQNGMIHGVKTVASNPQSSAGTVISAAGSQYMTVRPGGGESTAVTHVLPSVPVMSSSQHVSTVASNSMRMQMVALGQTGVQIVGSDPSAYVTRRPTVETVSQPILFINENGVPVLQNMPSQNPVTLIDSVPKTMPSSDTKKQQEQDGSVPKIGSSPTSLSQCSSASPHQNSTVTTAVDANGGIVRPVNGVIAAVGEPPVTSTSNQQAVMPNSSVQNTLANGQSSTVQGGCLVPINGPYVTHAALNMHVPSASDTTITQTSSFAQPVLQSNGVYVGQPVTLGQQGQIITLGGNAVFNTPGGVAPQQHFPSALILPNGQIIPVVTQPSMMYAAPPGGMGNGFVLAPTGRPQPGVPVQEVGIPSEFSLQPNKATGSVTLANNSSTSTLLIPQATSMPSVLPVHPQSVTLSAPHSTGTVVSIDGMSVAGDQNPAAATSVGNGHNGNRIHYGNATTASVSPRNNVCIGSSQPSNPVPKQSATKNTSKASKSAAGGQNAKRSPKSKPKSSRSAGSKTPPSSQQTNTKATEPETLAPLKHPDEKVEHEVNVPQTPVSEPQYEMPPFSGSSVNMVQETRNTVDVLMNSCQESENRENNCLALGEECFGSVSKSFSGTTDILAKATESIFSTHNLEISPSGMESLDDHLELTESQDMCTLPVSSEDSEMNRPKPDDQHLSKSSSPQGEAEGKDDTSREHSSKQSSDLLTNLTNSLMNSSPQSDGPSQEILYQPSTTSIPHSHSLTPSQPTHIRSNGEGGVHSSSLQVKNKESPALGGEPSRKRPKKGNESELCNMLVEMSSNVTNDSTGGEKSSSDGSNHCTEKDQDAFGTLNARASSSSNIAGATNETSDTFSQTVQEQKNFTNGVAEHSAQASVVEPVCSRQADTCDSIQSFSFPVSEDCSSLNKTDSNSSVTYASSMDHATGQSLQPLLLRSLSNGSAETAVPINGSTASSLPFLTLSPEETFGTGMSSKDPSQQHNSYGVMGITCTENTKNSDESQKSLTSEHASNGTGNGMESDKSSSETNHPNLLITSSASSVTSPMPMSSTPGTPLYCTTSYPTTPSQSHPTCKKSSISDKNSELNTVKNSSTDKGTNKECIRSSSMHSVTSESNGLVQKASSHEIPHSPSLNFVSSTPPLGSKNMTTHEDHVPVSPLSPGFSSRSLPVLNVPKENHQYAAGTPVQAPQHQPCISPFRYPPERCNMVPKSQSHLQAMLPSPNQPSVPHSPNNRVSSASPHSIPSPGYSHRTAASQNSLSLSSYSAEALIGHHTPVTSTSSSNSTTVSQNSNSIMTPPHSSQASTLQSPYSSVPSSPSPRTSRPQISYSAESLIRSHSSHDKIKDSSTRVPGSMMPSAYITSSYQCQQRSDHSNSRVPMLSGVHSTNSMSHCFPPRNENVQHCPSSVPSGSVPHLNQPGVQPNLLGNGQMTSSSSHANPSANNSFTPHHQNVLHPPFGGTSPMSSRHQLHPSGMDHSSPCSQPVSLGSAPMNVSSSLTSSYTNMTYSMESNSSNTSSSHAHHSQAGSESMVTTTSLSSCLQNLPNGSVRSSTSGPGNQQPAGCFFTGHSSSSMHSNSLMQISDPSFPILSNQSSLGDQHSHDSTLSRPPMFGNFSQSNAQSHLVNNLFPGHFIPNGSDVRNDPQVGSLAHRSNQGIATNSSVGNVGKRASSREQRTQIRSPAPATTKLPSPNKNRSSSKKSKQPISTEETNFLNAYSETNRHPNSANYFSVPELSTSRNDTSACYSTRYLATPQRSPLGTSPPSSHSVQHKAGHMGPAPTDISANTSYNPLFRPQTQNGLNLNFQPAGFGMNLHQVPATSSTAPSVQIGTHTSSASSHHMPNFNLSNIFPDITATNESPISLSPIKFPPPPNHILPPPPPHPSPSVQTQSHAEPSSLSHTTPHQNRGPQALYHTGRPHAPVIHNSVGFNTILGHNPHTFDGRSTAQMAVGINNGMAPPPPPFGPTHGHTPSFGNVISGLNFSAHDH